MAVGESDTGSVYDLVLGGGVFVTASSGAAARSP
jgi:hypothetical protein